LIALDRAYFGQRPFKTDQKQTWSSRESAWPEGHWTQ
jgi:hypothetical protein